MKIMRKVMVALCMGVSVSSMAAELMEFDSPTPASWSASQTGMQKIRLAGQPGVTRPWSVGETVTISFKAKVESSTDPVDLKRSNMNYGFGISSGKSSICWGVRLFNATQAFANMGIDTSASNPHTMSVHIRESDNRFALENIRGTSHDLYNNNDAAYFILKATYKGGTEYDLSMSMADSSKLGIVDVMSKTVDEGVKLERIEKFFFRVDLLSGSVKYIFSDAKIEITHGDQASSAGALTAALPPLVNDPSATLYKQWANEYGIVTAAGSDHDGDRLPDLFEYALGGDPATADLREFLPKTETIRYRGKSQEAYVFRRRVDAVERKIIYKPEVVFENASKAGFVAPVIRVKPIDKNFEYAYVLIPEGSTVQLRIKIEE